MVSRDFQKSVRNEDFSIDLFYDPRNRTVGGLGSRPKDDSLILTGYLERKKSVASYEVSATARRINKDEHTIPVDELPKLINAVQAYDPRGFSIRMEIKEVDIPGEGLSYYISAAHQVRDKQVILDAGNVDEAVQLIKTGTSIKSIKRPPSGREETPKKGQEPAP